MKTTQPIIFSAAMVEAIVDGRKTQTRRIPTAVWSGIEPGHLLYVREGRFMPRKKSRITLVVTQRRTGRLQLITDADIKAEGFTSAAEMRELWNKLRDFPGQRWEDDPVVIAISFTAQLRNIDDPS